MLYPLAFLLFAAQSQVGSTLDDFHLAASLADGPRYFEHFAPDAVFIGTDAGERWSLEEFEAFALPYFEAGKGWTYVATERHVNYSSDRKVAWFDERLQNESYGEVRGSGVLELKGHDWKIVQYNLSFPVPNDVSKNVVKKIAAFERVGRARAEEWVVEDGGRSLFLWNKVVASQLELAPEERPVVVLLPSASFSARGSWDLPLRDYSVMTALAERGFDVFAAELGGYGLSSPDPSHPVGGCESAVLDLQLMVEEICARRGVSKVVVVGPSWGAQVAGKYAMEFPNRVRGVVLYGFNWQSRIPADALRGAFGEFAYEGPFRPVDEQSARGDFIPGYFESDVPAAFAQHLLGQGTHVPSGALHDYANELPLVHPSQLRVPTLMLFGRLELAPEEARGTQPTETEYRAQQRRFYDELVGPKHWIEIPGAGHSAHLDTPHRLFQQCLIGWMERL